MKKFRKVAALTAFICALAVSVTAGAKTAEAAKVKAPKTKALAANEQIQTEGGRQYIYRDGVKVTSTRGWVKAGSYIYYFGKGGSAYQAKAKSTYNAIKDTDEITTKNVVLKKIGKQKYGFDQQGHLVKGIYCTYGGKKVSTYGTNKSYGTLLYFDKKTYALNTKKSTALQKYGKDGKSYKSLKKLLGKAKKTVVLPGSSCYGTSGKDVEVYFANVKVGVWKKGSTLKTVEYVEAL